MVHNSIRYGGGRFDFRTLYIQICCRLQKKKAMIYKSNPADCAKILNTSSVKGTFLEQIFATPAWHPIFSIESTDGDTWKNLIRKFKFISQEIKWQEKISPLTKKHLEEVIKKNRTNCKFKVDSETISRLCLKILYEVIFETPIQTDDEDVFYQASIEWRKELAIKGQGSTSVKLDFWNRLGKIVKESKFSDHFENKKDRDTLLSTFAQPFLISPQINVSDIFVAVFYFLRSDPEIFSQALHSAQNGKKSYLNGIILESIRLRHPFPVLEREDPKDPHIQYFIFLDQFQQDKIFDPNRWTQNSSQNPYHSLPFGTGPRMCAGKPIAMELLTELLQAILIHFPEEQIRPDLGHLYSGRNNDRGQSWTETLYQMRMFSKGLRESYRLGKNNNRTAKKSGCPFRSLLGS